VGRYAPVFVVVVLVRVVLLVESEECVKLDALLEVLDGLEATDVLEELEITEGVHASADKSVPVNTLQLDVGVVLLEGEGQRLGEVDVRALDGVHVLATHLKLVEVEVFRENLHFYFSLL